MTKLVTVITGANRPYKTRLIRLLNSLPDCANPIVYDLGYLGIGTTLGVDAWDFKQPGLMRCSFKPLAVSIACSRKPKTPLVAWIDADCIARFDAGDLRELIECESHYAVTVKRKHEIEHCAKHRSHYFSTVNAGVVFFKTEYSGRVSGYWMNTTNLCGGYDQVGLSITSGNRSERGVVMQSPAGLVKLLKTDDWNCYYHKEELALHAKVLHYKGGMHDPL